MQQSNSLIEDESKKVEAPYFMRPDNDPTVIEPGEAPELEQITPIETFNDYVAIVRDQARSTVIHTVGDRDKLPTGVVVGFADGSRLNFGYHVRFNDTMCAVKHAEYPGYEGLELVIVPEKHVLYRLPDASGEVEES